MALFLLEGLKYKMKRKISIDKAKAISLEKMAKTSLERLNSFDKLKYASNTLDDYYDILHKLMESLSSLSGIKFVGNFAHKELIDWVSDYLNIGEQNKLFLQRIRNYRNRISYEGFFIKPNFISQNEQRIVEIINKLNSKIKEMIS